MLNSQTYVIPHINVNTHSLDFDAIPEEANYAYERLDNKRNFGLGLHIKHYIIPKWSVEIGSSYNFMQHSFTFNSFGFVPRYDHYYRLTDFGMGTGVVVLEGLEFSVGYKKMIFFDQTLEYSDVYNEKVSSSNVDSYFLMLSYEIKEIVFTTLYTRSFGKSSELNLDMISLGIGYRFKVLNEFKGKNRVNCPAIK